MRDLKFRAWHQTEKKMYEWEPCDGLQDFGSLWNLLNGDLWQYEIMQHTGLKDKNEKEIYEGDIVNVHIFTPELGENMGVREGEKEFIAQIEFGPAGVFLKGKNNNDSGPIWAYCGMHEESFCIIGNIYENPELINGRIKESEWEHSG